MRLQAAQLIANEECQPAPAGLGSTVYFGFPDKPALKCFGTVTIDTDEDAQGEWVSGKTLTEIIKTLTAGKKED